MTLDPLAAALIAAEENAELLRGPQGEKGETVVGPQGMKGAQGTHTIGSDGAPGQPGIIWRGSWKARATYAAGDAVEADGSAYVAVTESQGSKPPGPAWDLLAKKGADGQAGPPGFPGRPGTNGTGGGGLTLTQSDTDPGAVGAGNLWLEVIFGDPNADGGDGRLWVRNTTDDGWNSAGPFSFSDDTTTLLASPDDAAELQLRSSGHGSLLSGGDSLKLSVGSVGWYLDAAGVHLGTGSGGPVFVTGSADPSAGGGHAAPVGSVYLRVSGGVGSLWQKIGAAATDWEEAGGATATPTLAQVLAAGNDPNGVAIQGATVDGGVGGTFAVTPGQSGGNGGEIQAYGGDGPAATPGGEASIRGGNGDGGTNEGSSFEAKPGSETDHGRAEIFTAGAYGGEGTVLRRRGIGGGNGSIWEDIDGSTVSGPAAFGDPSDPGAGTKYSRDDHGHGLPAIPVAAAVADIPDPSSATAEDVANKINELMASLRTAGLLAA